MTFSSVSSAVQDLLKTGLDQGLYTGAAAGVSTAKSRVTVAVGTPALDDSSPIGTATLFDLASVSKTFVATILVRLSETGVLDLDAPVSAVLPVSSGPSAEAITLRQLLSHTAGFPAESFAWRENPDLAPEDRLAHVLATPLETAPGTTFRYSCLGYIAAGAIAERATGATLPELLGDVVLRPLGIESVRYGPVEPSEAVATEDEPWVGRGMVRGSVHDELNWYLGGRVGNAGLFGSVGDVLVFAESFRDRSLLGRDGLQAMTTDALAPGSGAPFGQALGPRLHDAGFMGAVDGIGHLGFTGTLWIVDPTPGTAGVLLTNSVHPSRGRADIAPFQRRFSELVSSLGDAERAG